MQSNFKNRRRKTEIIYKLENTWSLSLKELKDIQQDFRYSPGKQIITCLLQYYHLFAPILAYNMQELEGEEACIWDHFLGKRPMGRKVQDLSLQRRLLPSMKEMYPFKEVDAYHTGNRANMERYPLPKVPMMRVIYSDLDNDEVSKYPKMKSSDVENTVKVCAKCTISMCLLLTGMTRKDREEPPVGVLASQLRQYNKNPSLWPEPQKWWNWIRSLKRMYLAPSLYGPISQLLAVSILPLKIEDIVGTHHVPFFGFTYTIMSRTWGNGIENLPWPQRHVC